jgi:hypothetical protein
MAVQRGISLHHYVRLVFHSVLLVVHMLVIIAFLEMDAVVRMVSIPRGLVDEKVGWRMPRTLTSYRIMIAAC